MLPSIDVQDVDAYLVWTIAGAASEATIDGRLVETDATAAKSLITSLPSSVRKAAGTYLIFDRIFMEDLRTQGILFTETRDRI